MRIISGTLKARQIKAPQGSDFRPTTDRVKENIFNILGEKVKGAKVLDIFAGSGSLGLESISRGSSEVFFIDKSEAAVEVIKKNLEYLSIFDKAQVIKGDASRELHRLSGRSLIFDLIFLDPPYNINVAELQSLFSLIAKCLDSSGLIIYESGSDLSEDIVASIKEIDKRSYGNTRVYFFKKTG